MPTDTLSTLPPRNVKEVSILNDETQSYLQRYHHRSSEHSLHSHRTAVHRPSWELFQDKSFSDYARTVILGLSLDTPTKQTIDPSMLSDGITKIHPPAEWHCLMTQTVMSHDAIAKLIIPSPISQCMIYGRAGSYEFQMMVGKRMTVAEYQTLAEEYQREQLGDQWESKEYEQLVVLFWKNLRVTMKAPMYGADMEGSLFEGDCWGWNVNELDTCLQLLRMDGDLDSSIEHTVAGVTNSYLYFGMWSSIFAAHVEDMNLLSINYLHSGAPKYWYAIAPSDSTRFESYMRLQFPDSASQCTEFLRHKCFLLSPSKLLKAGIRVTTQIQYPGEFIITFPQAYHFGFNMGFNVAESANFAIPEWIENGKRANICLCRPESVRIDMKWFCRLLDMYDQDQNQNTTKGITPKVGYLEWVRNRRISQKYTTDSSVSSAPSSDISTIVTSKGLAVRIHNHTSMGHATNHKPSPSIPLKQTQNNQKLSKPRIRISLKPHNHKTLESSHTHHPPQQQNTHEQWHLAICGKSTQFQPHTAVICLLVYNHNEHPYYYAGTITSIMEGHVRIHFKGSTKQSDIWLALTSSTLFLDGGVVLDLSEHTPKQKTPDNKSLTCTKRKKLKS